MHDIFDDWPVCVKKDYVLRTITIHHGNEHSGQGHYSTCIRNLYNPAFWFHYNDSTVEVYDLGVRSMKEKFMDLVSRPCYLEYNLKNSDVHKANVASDFCICESFWFYFCICCFH